MIIGKEDMNDHPSTLITLQMSCHTTKHHISLLRNSNKLYLYGRLLWGVKWVQPSWAANYLLTTVIVIVIVIVIYLFTQNNFYRFISYIRFTCPFIRHNFYSFIYNMYFLLYIFIMINLFIHIRLWTIRYNYRLVAATGLVFYVVFTANFWFSLLSKLKFLIGNL